MEPTPFKRDIDRAYTRLKLSGLAYSDMCHSYEHGDIKDACRIAFEFAYQTERLALLARTLPALTGSPAANEQMDRLITEAAAIRIGRTAEGWFGVEIPSLLPKKEQGGAEFIRKSLYLALGQYFMEHERLRVSDCVLTVCHRYRRERPERQYRDHDNIELNAVVDAIAFYVLHDDAPLKCSHHYCSLADDKDAATVLLVPHEEFCACYERLRTGPRSLFSELSGGPKNA